MSTEEAAGVTARLDRLESLEAIRALKIRYAQLCDQGYDADALVGLFTEDALWDAGDRGHCEGREAIRSFWSAMEDQIPFGIHYITNHMIEFQDPDHASGIAYLWQPLTIAGEPSWSATVYRERYRREDVWRFAVMRLSIAFVTRYAEPWAVRRSFLEE